MITYFSSKNSILSFGMIEEIAELFSKFIAQDFTYCLVKHVRCVIIIFDLLIKQLISAYDCIDLNTLYLGLGVWWCKRSKMNNVIFHVDFIYKKIFSPTDRKHITSIYCGNFKNNNLPVFQDAMETFQMRVDISDNSNITFLDNDRRLLIKTASFIGTIKRVFRI